VASFRTQANGGAVPGATSTSTSAPRSPTAGPSPLPSPRRSRVFRCIFLLERNAAFLGLNGVFTQSDRY
jgi:hypothetical protein